MVYENDAWAKRATIINYVVRQNEWVSKNSNVTGYITQADIEDIKNWSEEEIKRAFKILDGPQFCFFDHQPWCVKNLTETYDHFRLNKENNKRQDTICDNCGYKERHGGICGHEGTPWEGVVSYKAPGGSRSTLAFTAFKNCWYRAWMTVFRAGEPIKLDMYT